MIQELSMDLLGHERGISGIVVSHSFDYHRMVS